MIRGWPGRHRLIVLAGLCVSTLIVVLWIFSIGRQIRYAGDYCVFDFANNGCVIYYRYWRSSGPAQTMSAHRGFYLYPASNENFGFIAPGTGRSGPFTFIRIPLWLILTVILIPTLFMWNRDRRPPPGHCRYCRYNLTGNVSGVCPECGRRISDQDVTAAQASSSGVD